MLQVAAPFPHTGAEAFLRGTARKVTIIQRNADGSCTVKLHPPRFLSAAERIEWASRGASLTTKVDGADLYETEELAVHLGRKPRRHRIRTPRAR